MPGTNENAQAIPTQSFPPLSPYGCDVQPQGPLQDMSASIQTIAGTEHDRDSSPSEATGGMGGMGYGGSALPNAPETWGL